MPRQVAVIGLGRFGASLASTLFQVGHDVLAIDISERLVQELMGKVTYAVVGDATSEALLREVGIANFDMAVVSISDIQASLMVTVLLKTMGMPYIVARAQNQLHGTTLERIGANKVIYPEQEMGMRLAHSIFNPDVLEYMELGSNYGISKVKLPERFATKTLGEIGLGGAKNKYGLAVLAIRRGKEDLTLLPDSGDRFQAGDLLVVFGRDEQVERLHTEKE